jgi:hypothetical protein
LVGPGQPVKRLSPVVTLFCAAAYLSFPPTAQAGRLTLRQFR